MNKVVQERRGNIFEGEAEHNDGQDLMSSSAFSQGSNRYKRTSLSKGNTITK